MTLRQNRDELVLATKFTTNFQAHEKDKIQSNFGGNGTKSMRLSVEASLSKLRTSYIDLLYVHWWDYTVSIPELMQGLNDLVTSGKVIYLGMSDAPAWVVSKANQYARDHGLRQFAVYQGLWSAAVRDFERDIIPMCLDEGMGICPWGALGQGRFRTEAGFKEREKNNPGRKTFPVSERERNVSRVLERISGAKGTSLLGIALAYVFHKAPYVFPIVGGRTLEHIKGNITSLGLSLTEDDINEIDSAYEFDHGFPHTVLSGSWLEGSTPRQADGPGGVWFTRTMGNFDWVEAPKSIDLVQAHKKV